MPTSEQNLKSLTNWLTKLSDADLAAKARRYAALPAQQRARWEVSGVDVWATRELPSLSKIRNELPSLSLPGLKRLEEHLQQRLQLVKEAVRRRRKRGHPYKADMWIASAFYYELKKRRLPIEANRFRTKLDVNYRTLKRYHDNPHRDER